MLQSCQLLYLFHIHSLLMTRDSDYTGSQTKLPKILLNGNNICMVGSISTTVRQTRLIVIAHTRWRGTYRCCIVSREIESKMGHYCERCPVRGGGACPRNQKIASTKHDFFKDVADLGSLNLGYHHRHEISHLRGKVHCLCVRKGPKGRGG